MKDESEIKVELEQELQELFNQFTFRAKKLITKHGTRRLKPIKKVKEELSNMLEMARWNHIPTGEHVEELQERSKLARLHNDWVDRLKSILED